MVAIMRLLANQITVLLLIFTNVYLMIHTAGFAIECPKPAVQFDEDFKLEVKGELDIGLFRRRINGVASQLSTFLFKCFSNHLTCCSNVKC